MKYIVDMQGFKISLNEFVFKEVAVVALEEDPTPSVFIFKPPHAWEKLLDKNKSENRLKRISMELCGEQAIFHMKSLATF